jgi:hypothetical protein
MQTAPKHSVTTIKPLQNQQSCVSLDEIINRIKPLIQDALFRQEDYSEMVLSISRIETRTVNDQDAGLSEQFANERVIALPP